MRIVTGLLLLILISVGSDSCQKEFTFTDVDSTIVIAPPVTGSFTANIDGVSFVANKVVQAAKTLHLIAITGESVDGQLILLRVADSGVHVYSLDINSSSNAGAYTKDGGYAYATNQGNTASESGGTLSVTSIDTTKKTMSGTFSIKVYRSMDMLQKNITEGAFSNVLYETAPSQPANTLDTFKVKADGTQFPVFSIEGISAFNLINLSASNQALSKTLGLSFPSNITPGTYAFALFDPDYNAQYNIDSSYLAGDSGTLTILEHNTTTKRIRGNFNFHASEIIGTLESQLSEGYFSLIYQ